MPRDSDLLTPKEASRLAGVSKQAINDALNRGTLPHVLVKVDATRVLRGDVLAYIARTQGNPKN